MTITIEYSKLFKIVMAILIVLFLFSIVDYILYGRRSAISQLGGKLFGGKRRRRLHGGEHPTLEWQNYRAQEIPRSDLLQGLRTTVDDNYIEIYTRDGLYARYQYYNPNIYVWGAPAGDGTRIFVRNAFNAAINKLRREWPQPNGEERIQAIYHATIHDLRNFHPCDFDDDSDSDFSLDSGSDSCPASESESFLHIPDSDPNSTSLSNPFLSDDSDADYEDNDRYYSSDDNNGRYEDSESSDDEIRVTDPNDPYCGYARYKLNILLISQIQMLGIGYAFNVQDTLDLIVADRYMRLTGTNVDFLRQQGFNFDRHQVELNDWERSQRADQEAMRNNTAQIDPILQRLLEEYEAQHPESASPTSPDHIPHNSSEAEDAIDSNEEEYASESEAEGLIIEDEPNPEAAMNQAAPPTRPHVRFAPEVFQRYNNRNQPSIQQNPLAQSIVSPRRRPNPLSLSVAPRSQPLSRRELARRTRRRRRAMRQMESSDSSDEELSGGRFNRYYY